MPVGGGAPREHVATVSGGRVVALAGDHYGAIAAVDDHRLMPGRMAGSWQDEHAREDLRVTVDDLVREPGRIDEVRQGVAIICVRRLEFDSLGEDRASREAGVAAAVVEMKVAVDDDADVFGLRPAPANAWSNGYRFGW